MLQSNSVTQHAHDFPAAVQQAATPARPYGPSSIAGLVQPVKWTPRLAFTVQEDMIGQFYAPDQQSAQQRAVSSAPQTPGLLSQHAQAEEHDVDEMLAAMDGGDGGAQQLHAKNQENTAPAITYPEPSMNAKDCAQCGATSELCFT